MKDDGWLWAASLNWISFSNFIAYMYQIKIFLAPKTLVILIEICSYPTYTLPMINLEPFYQSLITF
jgi:hypothetical protein